MTLKTGFTSRGIWTDGIFIARVFTAIIIMQYGLELFDNQKMKDLTGFLSEVGFPLPEQMGYLAKITEFFGGLLLGIGFLTRIVTIPLMVTMVVVIYLMGGGNIFSAEGPFLLLLLFLIFFLAGPGRWSVDYLLFERSKKSSTLKI